MSVAIVALLASGALSTSEPGRARPSAPDCAPRIRTSPDLVERRCVPAVGEVPHFVARDLEVHLPPRSGGEVELGLRVAGGTPAVRLLVSEDSVRLPGVRPIHVGPGPLTISLSGERLSIDAGRGPRALPTRVLDRAGRVHVASSGEGAPLRVALDRIGS